MDMTSNSSIHELRSQVVSAGYASGTAKYIASAKGSILTDVEGNEIIDFAGGIAVMNVGHSHPKVVEAIKDQAEKFTHTCFMVNPYPGAVRLADRLVKATPGDFPKKAVFINSGAEAVENAIKIARYYTKRPGVVVFDAAYHGRTCLTMTMTAKVKPYKWGFGPFAPEVYQAPFGDIEAFKESFITGIDPENTAAVIAEPVLGEGGFLAPPDDFYPQVAEFCKEHGILFIADEIQTGFGRTGKMFAMEHWGVEPDLMTCAKSLAAGMPISAVVGRAEIMDAVHPGGLGGTYGANPLACAAANAVFDIFEQENLLEQSVKLGDTLGARFGQWLEKFANVGEIRGLGAMRGITIVTKDGRPDADTAKKLSSYCFDRGLSILVCGIHGNVIRVLMPLNIEDELLEKGLSIMEAGLSELNG
ncbi:4-aminobutyrate--2-oxoglutarate transaminase [Desulforhopalus singaporensis]|uniref:4-aminobutyrate aminotransferase / (S)-3-amino-2-methylpropionate transaminase n=1 Tax=Desulforhopalus singaporensis TaxID=91360 RepID=A0A1H0KDY3_9BACT|nr:4-aminobutyrate--2-oxoglutarate transaminase [Desulforhopalus singaporensis]SDO53932.1 4-aminobutyrate aminotransferase / (S)-3-amino-2-methylpropionate transaminase [Desulforhopalus singaporensis]